MNFKDIFEACPMLGENLSHEELPLLSLKLLTMDSMQGSQVVIMNHAPEKGRDQLPLWVYVATYGDGLVAGNNISFNITVRHGESDNCLKVSSPMQAMPTPLPPLQARIMKRGPIRNQNLIFWPLTNVNH